MHPETTIEDIKNDLADSNITVKDTDIEKKSNKDAYLCSYKISVPAADLQKALDPAIWPLRVKVREFIHYAKRNPKSKSGPRNGDSGNDAGQGQGAPEQVQGQPGGAAGGNNYGGAKPKTVSVEVPMSMSGLPLKNMFEMLSRHPELGGANL